MIIDERIDDDGRSVATRLELAGSDIRFAEPGLSAILPAGAVAAVMRRYGRELEDDARGQAVDEPLELSPGNTLQRMRFHVVVDAEARDYLVWREPSCPAIATLCRQATAALRFLAGRIASGSSGSP